MLFLQFLKRLIWGFIKRIFYGSSENRKCKFLVIISYHNSEMKKLLNTQYYKIRNFCRLLTQSYLDKSTIFLQAQELYLLDQKCEAYQKVLKSANLIFQKWEEFDSNDENPDEIDEALISMHSNAKLLEHHKMYHWIQSTPCPSTEYEKRSLVKLTEAGFKPYVEKIIQANQLSNIDVAQIQKLMTN